MARASGVSEISEISEISGSWDEMLDGSLTKDNHYGYMDTMDTMDTVDTMDTMDTILWIIDNSRIIMDINIKIYGKLTIS